MQRGLWCGQTSAWIVCRLTTGEAEMRTGVWVKGFLQSKVGKHAGVLLLGWVGGGCVPAGDMKDYILVLRMIIKEAGDSSSL